MIEQVIKPMPEKQYEQLKLLGEVLGVSADDIIQLANLKEAINEVKKVSKECEKLHQENAFIKEHLLKLAEYLQTKQDNFFNEWVTDLLKVFAGGDENE